MLDFAWPENLRAEVALRTLKIRDRGDGPVQRSVEGRYRMRAEGHPDGLRVVTEGLEVTRVDGRPVSVMADPADPMASALAPSFVVDAHGEVVEVEGVAAMRRAVVDRMGEQVPAAQRESVAGLAVRDDRLVQHWIAGVGQWVGREFEPGARYELEAEDGSPLAVEVSEPLPCSERDADRRCLQLVMLSHEGGDEAAARGEVQVHALTDQLGAPGLPSGLVKAFEQSERVEVVTEPERLIPHRILIRREKRVVVDVEGEGLVISAVDEEERRYAYED